jgi:ABC-type antimicrobial peptide transport system permease subunit
VKYRSLAEPAEPLLYEPRLVPRQSVVVATTLTDPTPLILQIRNVASAIDASIPVTVASVESVLSAATLRHRLGLLLMTLFGVLALTLAAVGIYGVIAHVTGERSREIATRMAFGATPPVVVRMQMREGIVHTGVGLAIGIAVALAGGRVIGNQLYAVSTVDSLVMIVAAAAAVLVIALPAFLIPALRAAHIRPAESLRGE